MSQADDARLEPDVGSARAGRLLPEAVSQSSPGGRRRGAWGRDAGTAGTARCGMEAPL